VDEAAPVSHSYFKVNRRQSEAAARYSERNRRENEAPRLRAMFPDLTALWFEVRERRSGVPVGEAGYIRRIMVSHAPALFLMPCGDPSCREGEHDITGAVLTALRSGQDRFDGQDFCGGHTGSAQCQRELTYVGRATRSGSLGGPRA
jgi:hypothetical protein